MIGPRAKVAALFAVALAAACSAGLPQPTPIHLAAAKAEDPSATLEDLSRGRSLYASKCSGCHALRDPVSLAPDDWRHELDEMQEKQGVRLAPQESRDILRYLDATTRVANSR
jgi:mono/diheme cytochrome c family protein